MKRLFLFLLFLSSLLHADFDQLFPEGQDPSLFHHVNVISGHLNLSFQDTVVQGAKPLSLNRSYSSSGALERSQYNNSDLSLQQARNGWMLLGGWNFFAYTNLLIEPAWENKDYKAYLPEPGGNLVSYSYSHKKDKSKKAFFLKPTQSFARSFGQLSAQTNPQNNVLFFDKCGQCPSLTAPDGTVKIFVGRKMTDYKPHSIFKVAHFYTLAEEVLPSKHRIIYTHDKNTDLVRMEMRNPKGNKVYASMDFQPSRVNQTYPNPTWVIQNILIKTSDNKQINYHTHLFENRAYISKVESSFRPEEISHYAKGHKDNGARVEYITLAGNNCLRVTYSFQKKSFGIDKVHTIEAPIGPGGAFITVATFSYAKGVTEARDANGILTTYYHDSEKLQKIDYFDKQGRLHSSQQLYWKGSSMVTKALLDGDQRPIFAKTFVYDSLGNVIEETLYGNLSGNASALTLDNQGHPMGGESYKKSYSYLPGFNVPLEESEEDGLSYKYFYKPDTNLITAKLTHYQKKIVRREFFIYDEDNLIIAELTDDGSSNDPTNLSDVRTRQIKRYDLDPASGQPLTISEYGLSDSLIRRTKLTYSPQKQVVAEAFYDTSDQYRYTIYTDYNNYGQVTRKTTPLGQENLYIYDNLGQLIEVKEVGSTKKIYTYDPAGRQTSLSVENKISSTIYDAKSRPISEIDARGNIIQKSYDDFDNCVTTTLPDTFDEQGLPYTPTIAFSYDVQGNLTSARLPRGETTQTFYNVWRKPIRTLEPDGSEKRQIYNKNGTLSKTINPDGTEIHYTYDPFQQVTSKITYASSGTLLKTETWTHSPFHILSHTDPRGLVTHYSYDSLGRKIAEVVNDRTTTFFYDTLSLLEKTCLGALTKCEQHDVGGRIIAQWEEDSCGRIENKMSFFYDADNHKIKAVRTTAQGEATDLFIYDDENRLIRHTDPLQNESRIFYDETTKNSLGQYTLKKTVVDPLGNSCIETHDAGDRIVFLEKTSPQGETVFREEFFYDCSGNKAKRISTILLEGSQTRIITASWLSDFMGRIIKESENEQKTTSYTYDLCGRLIQKILPSGLSFNHTYDGLNRPLSLISSDNSIHYEYFYEQGQGPTKIIDHTNSITLERRYNLFGEIIAETTPHHSLSWDYDILGRCTTLTLPDHSTITYAYEGAHMSQVTRGSYSHHYTQFDPNGHVSEETSLYGDLISTTHDLLERSSTQSSSYFSHSLSYGPSGLVTSVNNSLFGDKQCTYDALNQLTQEGPESYLFDSLGNPAASITNEYNQIVTNEDCQFTYDADGNPIEKRFSDTTTSYRYDALGRLVEIIYPEKRVIYIYDPLSRLYSKQTTYNTPTETLFFLYDREHEIGTLSQDGSLLQLKVLGLGLKGEIGAAIALELNQEIFVPLHDFMGNIITLINAQGQIEESYNITAFGQETLSNIPVNPWRFNSKRADEELVFFGLRFYDPSLGRWLTPDPAGFIDGANLYAYVGNSPLNRLDLFGLLSFEFNSNRIDVDLPSIPRAPGFSLLGARGTMGGIASDFIAASDRWHELQFTPTEIKTQKVNLLDHFPELCTRNSSNLWVNDYSNGIGTSFSAFHQTCEAIAGQNTDIFFLGLHNPSEGLIKDAYRNHQEQSGVITPAVCRTRNFLATVSEKLNKINKDAVMLHMCHSENGVITKRALEGLCPGHKEIVMKNLYVYAVGPSDPIPKSYAAQVSNVYSIRDYITKRFAKDYVNNPDYDISFLPCRSNTFQMTGYLADHNFLGPTYAPAWQDHIKASDTKLGLYGYKNQNR